MLLCCCSLFRDYAHNLRTRSGAELTRSECESAAKQAVALRDGQNAELGEVLDQERNLHGHDNCKRLYLEPFLLVSQEYTAGFYTDIESESLPKGLNEDGFQSFIVFSLDGSFVMPCKCVFLGEDIVRKIWEIKEEPDWMLEFRLNAFRSCNFLENVELKSSGANPRLQEVEKHEDARMGTLGDGRD